MYAHLKHFARRIRPSLRETTNTVLTVSVLLFFRRIFIERNTWVSVRVWRNWIPANPSLPSFWRAKKSIRSKPIGFGFNGLFDFLFLSCPNKFSVKWTRYFLYCTTTAFACRFRLGSALISDDRRASAEVNGEKRTELSNVWSLIFTKAGWFTGAASVSSKIRVLWDLWPLRQIVWSEYVPVTRKTTCRPEAISRYLASCSSLVCLAELFANLVDGDDSPWVWMELFFNFLTAECFQRAHESFIQGLHFVAAVSWKTNYVNKILSMKVMTCMFLVYV